MTGKRIDDHAAAIRATLKRIKATVARLERQGVKNAFPHFKPGGRKMFLKEPTDSSGKRRFHYVGVDPKAQQDALDRIERFHRSTAAKRDLHEVQRKLDGLGQELSYLEGRFSHLEKWCVSCAKTAETPKKRSAKDLAGGNGAGASRNSARNPGRVTGSRGPGRDRVTPREDVLADPWE